MTTGIIAACLRADRVLVGAAFVALATASATVAFENYTEQYAGSAVAERQTTRSVADVSRVNSPVELAAAQFGRDQDCLAEAMYFEARSEGVVGQKAVAEVVLQRVRSRFYPNTVCGVVYEGTERGDQLCQFSYACNGSLDEAIEPKAWERSSRLASRIMAGTVKLGGQTDRAIAYHTIAVTPEWAAGMVRTSQIGNHIFYRRAPVVRANAEADKNPPLRSGVLQADGTIVPFDPSRVPVSLLEIKSEIEIDGAVGNGT
jgi:spore germination cell wall hydrolase CwlJ-like protein